MPSRRDTMSLSTLSEVSDLTRVKNNPGLRTNRITSSNMLAHDIRGAAPKVEIPKEVNRQTFFESGDIGGAKPKILHAEVKRDYSSMNTVDIKGSKPQHLKF